MAHTIPGTFSFSLAIVDGALLLDHFLVFFKDSASFPCTSNTAISQGLTLSNVFLVSTTPLENLISTSGFNHFWMPYFLCSHTMKSFFPAIR